MHQAPCEQKLAWPICDVNRVDADSSGDSNASTHRTVAAHVGTHHRGGRAYRPASWPELMRKRCDLTGTPTAPNLLPTLLLADDRVDASRVWLGGRAGLWIVRLAHHDVERRPWWTHAQGAEECVSCSLPIRELVVGIPAPGGDHGQD